ncbi:MAG: hypothetical protein ACLR3C_00440 [Eggerthella lenta]
MEERCAREGSRRTSTRPTRPTWLLPRGAGSAPSAEAGRASSAPGGELRAIEDVHQEVLGLVEALLEDEGRGSR